jgi:mRNA-degrading endonuclease toxin of MazEF toxin-antitoxin module
VAFPDSGGQVIRGPHPAVIIQTDAMARSSTTIVVPMTSAPRAAEFAPAFLVAVSAREAGLDRDGWVKCDQPMTLPASLLGPRAGRLNPETLSRVDAALRFVFALEVMG